MSEVIDIKNGSLIIKNLKEVDSRVIQSIKTTRTIDSETTTITLYNKNQALTLLAKILNMITEKTEVTGSIQIIPAVRPKPISEKGTCNE
jgi:hypothetical protein